MYSHAREAPSQRSRRSSEYPPPLHPQSWRLDSHKG